VKIGRVIEKISHSSRRSELTLLSSPQTTPSHPKTRTHMFHRFFWPFFDHFEILEFPLIIEFPKFFEILEFS
jgi:hypothetical protein